MVQRCSLDLYPCRPQSTLSLLDFPGVYPGSAGPSPARLLCSGLRLQLAVEQKRKRRGASLRAERLCSLGLPSLVVPAVPQPQPRFFFRSPQPMSHWQVATTSRCSDRAHLLLLNGGVHACVYTFPAPLTEYSGDSRSLPSVRTAPEIIRSGQHMII